MEPLTNAQIKKLELRKAAEDESVATRNLLPPEPWQQILAAKPGYFARWITTRIESGSRNSRATVVNARKAHQAIRPVPIVGIAERVLLRGLTNWVLADASPPEPAADAYSEFVRGPLVSKLESVKEWLNPDFESLANDYVVQADIAAFYQYVDHNVLLNELQMQTENVEGSIRVVDLLAEIQGTNYGLPQLLDSSDRLAEVYMGIIERDLRRRGYLLWRYNDDFKIAVNGYSSALQALEDLSSVAHSVGLILNDSKSSIVKFETYYKRHFIAENFDDEAEDVSPAEQIEIGTVEYSDEEELEKLEQALSFVERIDASAADPLDLRALSFDDVRQLRKSLNTLKRNQHDAALSHIQSIARFVPQLTPTLSLYVIAMAEADDQNDHIEDWKGLTTWSGGYNIWQRAWLVYVARQCNYASDDHCSAWIRAQMPGSEGTLLHAEAALALAPVGGIDFDELDQFVRTQPEPLVPWYLLSIASLDGVDADRIEAVKQSSALGRLLLGG